MQRTQVPCVLECRGAKFSGQVQYPLDAAQKRSIQAAQQNTQQHPAYLGRITLPQSRHHWTAAFRRGFIGFGSIVSELFIKILCMLRCQLWRNTHRAAAVVLMTGSAHLHRNRLAAFEIGVCPPALYAPSAYAPSNPCYQHTQCASGYPWLTHCNTPFKNALASIQRSFELFVAHKLTAFAHNSIMEALSRRESSRALTVWSQNVAGWMGF